LTAAAGVVKVGHRVADQLVGSFRPWRSSSSASEENRVPGVRVGSAVLVIDEAGRVLLGRRAKSPNQGRWVLPGGKIESFESIDAAGIREVREETGLDIRVVKRLGVDEIIDPPHEHRLIVFSLANVTSGTLTASSDLTEARFVEVDALSELDLTEITVRVLAHAGLIPDRGFLVSA
jgi:ADP-ribose pyrophosphatase YjhB (NUDIX family)